MGMEGHNYDHCKGDVCKKCGKIHINPFSTKSAWSKGLTKETDPRLMKTSISLTGRQFSEGHKKNIERNVRENRGGFLGENNPFYGRHHTDETRELISKNNTKPFLGKHHTKEAKEKISRANSNPSEETRKNYSRANKKKWEDPEYRKNNISARSGVKRSESSKRKMRAGLKKYIKENPEKFRETIRKATKANKNEKWLKAMHSDEFKEKQRKNIMKQGMFKSTPTKPERRFEELINKYALPYKYVGNGQFWMGYPPKCPDFLNVNGEKKVVEIHGVYWHLIRPQKEHPNLTREVVEEMDKRHYAQYGFDCIILWEDELKDDQYVLNQIGITAL